MENRDNSDIEIADDASIHADVVQVIIYARQLFDAEMNLESHTQMNNHAFRLLDQLSTQSRSAQHIAFRQAVEMHIRLTMQRRAHELDTSIDNIARFDCSRIGAQAEQIKGRMVALTQQTMHGASKKRGWNKDEKEAVALLMYAGENGITLEEAVARRELFRGIRGRVTDRVLSLLNLYEKISE
jgi:hypothetical protein